MSTIIQNEPSSFEEAVKQQVWKDAMNEEYESIMKNDVWDVVPRPQDKTIVTSKWLYNIKHGADGSAEKYKDCFVARGFSQKEGADPLIHKCKRELASEFKMKDLGLIHYFLGLEVWQKLGEVFLSQGKYVVKILERFGMVDCKLVTTPTELNFKKLCRSFVGPALGNAYEFRQLIGALMFLVNSRSDICFVVNMLSQYMVEPHHSHWIGAKNILRYLRGTITYGLRYSAEDVRLHGYSEVDWVGIVVDQKSTFGCCFSLGSASISWMSRKQKSVALSTAEAEYIAACMASCEAVWLRKLFSELLGHTLDTTVLLCDNQSGIRLSENPVFHDRSKHIDIRYHFIWDMVQGGAIRLHHIGTDE
eukprot:PITA_24229